MLSDHHRLPLFRAMDSANCVLFLGAGFSTDATSTAGRPIPAGSDLAAELWEFMGYSGQYDGTELSEIYAAALESSKPLQHLRAFLEERLLVRDAPPWFATITRCFWHRIYTTNVDDLTEHLFRAYTPAAPLTRFLAPAEDFRERDQFLRTIQLVKLNGSLPGDPRSLTFSPRQYARRTTEHDVWYDQFIRDYVFHPTIFIGTQLREPLFWQAIEARERRGQNPEERPRSFLVTKHVSPAKLPILESLNVIPVEATAEGFLEWLAAAYSFPDRHSVLATVAPDLTAILDVAIGVTGVAGAMPEFLSAFQRVPLFEAAPQPSKLFFLGAPPSWNEIAADYDAPMESTKELLARVQAALAPEAPFTVFGLLGTGGCGKSTALKRVSLALRQGGRQVFYTDGAQKPLIGDVVKALEAFPNKVVLVIDNATLLGKYLIDLVNALGGSPRPPILLFAARYNMFERQLRGLESAPNVHLCDVPNLTERDIHEVLKVLDRFHQLGHLEDLTYDERVREFKIRARKQLLVALREATEGAGFDDIVKSEFAEVDTHEARVMYLCAALATSELIDLSEPAWLACAAISPNEALSLLTSSLKGLLHLSIDSRRVVARHPIIAELVLDAVARREDVVEAYKRTLASLAHGIYGGEGRRNRSWRLFVRLINHAAIYERFSSNIVLARQIYESIAGWFRKDGHYWLQYANLEIEYGEAMLARSHLAHAESLMPDDDLLLTTKAHLLLRESLDAGSLEAATRLRQHAEEILNEQMDRLGFTDEYPHHVYLTQALAWIHRWHYQLSFDEHRAFLEKLDEKAEETAAGMPLSRRIKKITGDIHTEYLSLALR